MKSKCFLNQATTLRAYISNVFGFAAPDRIILTPGSLIALRLVFATCGTRRLVLGNDEYYCADHFPELTIRKTTLSLPRSSKHAAVIRSLVSWKGRRLASTLKDPSFATFLRIIDASHAGAAGLPTLHNLAADLIIGNSGHWLGRGASKVNLGFLYVANAKLWPKLAHTFRMFYLAVEGEPMDFQSRWLDPVILIKNVQWLVRHRTNRARVRKQHGANLRLARHLATHLLLPKPSCALLWSNEYLRHRALAPLRKAGLVWHPPQGGTRVMCRADLLAKERT